MPSYVAFLRAINLGPTRKFPKAAIVAATEAAGFTGVETHINTGNVRFDTRMWSRGRIEAALEQAYREDRGFEVPTMVFTVDELRQVADDADRFAEGHDGRHYVSLLKSAPTAAARQAAEAFGGEGERVRISGRAAHLLLGENYHEATVDNARLEKVLGTATNRNLTVIRAVAKKWC